ncbi:hypothetical protein NZK35_15235 [Stieleria sp. ICT_E10.1]|uniref:hypothetical protein n=1 Tax=Stieleria sedimenti TaxID=2976331 RepID=UPI00218024FC|nr:hypothetical protein [Stieleria sedimenti]MCS7468007.1 hypothetical protein [Stieleria sedimenti]
MKWISRNVRNYLIALTVLSIAAGVYRAAAQRLLTVPDVARVEPRPPTQRVDLKEDLADLFPADAWQLGDCKRLLTSNGALLFENWRQISEDQWKLEPLTIVVGRGLSDDAAATPIVLTAKEGAEIQFAQSLDMMGGSAPPIKMGRMIGDVEIERRGTTKRSDTLAVQTRNVRIDNRKVWTTERIAMQVAGAELVGSDLTIYLAASATSATKAEVPSTLLDRMDLVYLEELRIPLNDPAQDPNRPRRIGTKEAADDQGEISIKCKNGLIYDFALDRLSLRDSITMVRTVRGQPIDTFSCDTVDLILRDPSNRSVVRRGPLDWIDRVHATGRPARIRLTSYDFQLAADEIEFDAVGGLLIADAAPEPENAHPVVIRRGNLQATLDRFAYQYNPETPETIGVVDVRGQGHVSINDAGIMLRDVSWTESFKLQPTGQATVTAVKEKREQSKLRFQIDGDIQARLSDGGIARAGAVEGILKPHYVEQPVDSFGGSSSIGHPESSESIVQPAQQFKRTMTLLPESFHALESVTIDSNELLANMNRLSLFFQPSADFGKRTTAAKTSGAILPAPGQEGARPAATSPGGLASFVNQPDPSRQPDLSSQLRSPVARPRPKLSGDHVSAELLITPAGVQPKDVSIVGDVLVEHQVNAGTTTLPIQMSGQTMRMQRSAVTQASGQDYLQLGSGPDAPARLRMGDGYFVGPMIKVWPSENVVQVTGAGEMKVPAELLAPDASSKPAEPQLVTSPAVDSPAVDSSAGNDPLSASSIDWTSPPICRWGGNMQFDGQAALLTGGVQIDSEFVSGSDPWLARMNGGEMQITLANPVQFMDRASMATAELASVSLVQTEQHAVVVRAEQRSSDLATQSVHVITAARLDFSPGDGGRLMGTGPGWYRGWMLMDQDSSILAPEAAQSDHLGGLVLQGVHLTFREAMHGDLKHETLEFSGGVRTGVRKVSSWDEVVDVAQMERLAVGEMTMDCRQLKFGVSPGTPADLRSIPGMPTPWEMIADGGVVVRTNTEKRGLIEGTAARVSYESKKSWLNVQGTQGQSAFVRQTWPDGRKGFQTHSPRMLLNLKTFEFQTVMQDAQFNNVTLPK